MKSCKCRSNNKLKPDIIEMKDKEHMKKLLGLILISGAAFAQPPVMNLVNPYSDLIRVEEDSLPALPEAESIQQLKDGTIRLHRFEREVPKEVTTWTELT